PFSDPSNDAEEDWKVMKKEIGAVINVCASMVAVGVAVWWVMYQFGPEIKIVLSLLSAFTIGAIETFLYVRFFENLKSFKGDREAERREEKKGRRREAKMVPGTKMFKVE
ncbi:hypothetical protein BT69DRAFT_1279863, partial [Atractiella rhizophila]